MKIRINNLTFKYSAVTKPVFENVSFAIKDGEFVVIAGESGCGKTTLLKCLKPELMPAGDIKGDITFDAAMASEYDLNLQSDKIHISPLKIGYVFQNPDDGIVCDKVWHELVFSLENQGMSQNEMQERLDFLADYFGIRDILNKNVKELSGGQKQIVNLAAAVIGEPELLILDEPVSQLDPEMADIFINFLTKLNKEKGITIIMSEHRFDAVTNAADRIVFMEKGKVSKIISPEELNTVVDKDNSSFEIDKLYTDCVNSDIPILELCNISYAYRSGENVLNNLSLKVYKGEVLVLSGDNGSGKTTALLLLAGGMKPSEGQVIRRVRSGMVPQNPVDVFSADPINLSISNEIAELVGLSDVYYSHPYDLSGGQQQRLALALVLEADPEAIILDEPTKGLDCEAKNRLKGIISELKSRGKAVIIVSHDKKFCSEIADRVVEMERVPRNLPNISAFPNNLVEPGIEVKKHNTEFSKQLSISAENKKNHRIKMSAPAVWIITIALIAATILGDLYLFSDSYSIIVSLIVIIEMMFPFLLSFEKKNHSARKLSVLAVIIAIAVASRAVFFMLPEFKPISAFVIIAAIAFGAEEGFLVGAFSALISDFLFGLGPWSPWQMFALGIIGFVSGIIYRNKHLLNKRRKEKTKLCLLGILLVICIYGGIMNLASVLMWNQYPSLDIIIASYVTGFPADCIHAAATAIFLWVLAKPMLEKIYRIKVKYKIS